MSDHDDKTTRCRRLGNEVPFRYCCAESGDKPCRLILDCWWERFDVRACLRERLSAEVMAELETPAPPPDKTLSIAEIIEETRRRLASDDPPTDGP